jgi:hypothetical protein
MDDINSQITKHFDFLKECGLVFNYTESNGKLGDRKIQKFTYDNLSLGKKFEIVYCTTNFYSSLYGFLIKSDKKNNNPLDPHNFIPFDRLRCFYDEGGEIIFFGNEQNDLSYKLKEFKLVIDKFLTCATSNDWVDYSELLKHEKKIYVLTLEPKNNFIWADELKADNFVKNSIDITFDASVEPPYEAYGLKLKSKNNIEFHITHGYKSRDDVGFSIQVTFPDKKSEEHELMNVGTKKVVELIKQMVST